MEIRMEVEDELTCKECGEESVTYIINLNRKTVHFGINPHLGDEKILHIIEGRREEVAPDEEHPKGGWNYTVKCPVCGKFGIVYGTFLYGDPDAEGYVCELTTFTTISIDEIKRFAPDAIIAIKGFDEDPGPVVDDGEEADEE
jgi:hypothetical protein